MARPGMQADEPDLADPERAVIRRGAAIYGGNELTADAVVIAFNLDAGAIDQEAVELRIMPHELQCARALAIAQPVKTRAHPLRRGVSDSQHQQRDRQIESYSHGRSALALRS